MRKVPIIILVLVILSLVMSACNLPRATPTADTTGPNLINTYAAQTVEALGTQLANVPPTNPAETASVPTNTPQQVVSATLEPTTAVQPTATTLPPSATPQPCDRVRFVKDVTIPDGTSFAPGAAFTKTWELENAGSCTWNSSYALVFANEGNAMGGPASKQLTTGSVAPGQKVQVSVDLKAPATSGSFRGFWALRNSAGVVFGIGADNKSFYVDIKVSGVSYNFLDNYCKAEWRSGAGVLSCPGSTSDANGFVVKVDNSQFGSRGEDEPSLWLNPQAVDNGEIRGTFPALAVNQGSHFKGFLGCQKNANNCDIKFQLNYKADGGAEQTFKEWSANYNSFVNLDTDLSSLAGKSVVFILIVKANGPMNQDQALVLLPRLE